MRRTFDEHVTRRVVSLDGAWQFITDPEGIGEEQKWYCELPEGAVHTEVPSCWNNSFGLLEYEGVAWYSRDFYCEGGCIRLSFGAVMTEATVWLDGERLGEHYGGFTAFDFIAMADEGYHTLTVRVDNRFNADSIPQAKVDWYHYGGIVRGVDVEYLRGLSVLSCYLDYKLNETRDTAEVVVRAKVFNASEEEVTAPLTVSLDEEMLICGDVTLGAFEEAEVESTPITVSDIYLWDMDTPNLYSLVAQTPTDDLYDRVGFRTIEVKDGKFQLNGRAIEIRGVCRHEEHPEFGFAFPRALMQRDIDIVKNMSSNAIRGAHYPNSKAFVDMLDEQGILFWSEIPIWGVGFSEEALSNPTVVARGLEMIREMVAQYYNHPSIIIWGMHNEILTGTQAAYEMSRQYHDELRANGGNRLVTHATARPLEDICYEFDDIICINHYTGWYGGDMKNWAKVIEGHKARRDALGFADKPIIYSEFGGAALYGHHTFDDIKWTEEYQARLFAHCLELFHKTPEIVGWYIWQFTDMRTCREMGNDRARGFNNKGILNEYRKPKMAYHTVREKCRRFAEEEK